MSYKYQLPEGYGYVIAAGAFTGVALYITSSLAQAQRSKLGVEYPNLYASDVTAKQDKRAYEFNCHQRGALNPHESHPITLFGLAFGGLTFPIPAAAAGEPRFHGNCEISRSTPSGPVFSDCFRLYRSCLGCRIASLLLG